MAGAGTFVPDGQLGLTVAATDPARQTVIVRLEVERQPARFAAIWEQSVGPAWQARHGLSAGQYQRTFTELIAQGFRLVDVSGYTSAGEDRYAAIWEQSPGPPWEARHGLSADQYQQAFNELAAQGFRLVDVSGYGSAGQDRYAAIWEQRDGPAWQARHGLTSFRYQQDFQQQVATGHRLIGISGYNPHG